MNFPPGLVYNSACLSAVISAPLDISSLRCRSASPNADVQGRTFTVNLVELAEAAFVYSVAEELQTRSETGSNKCCRVTLAKR